MKANSVLFLINTLVAVAAGCGAGNPSLASSQTVAPSPTATVRFKTRDVAGNPHFREPFGDPSPPPLPAGVAAEGPAADDPEGHWGAVEQGAQLSLRLATNRVAAGAPVTAYVSHRNHRETPLAYKSGSVQGGVCNFNLWNVFHEEARAASVPSLHFSDSWWPISPHTQHRSWVRLDKVFDLSGPGHYVVRAVACITVDPDGEATTVVSGPVRFEILPAAKGKAKAERETGGPRKAESEPGADH